MFLTPPAGLYLHDLPVVHGVLRAHAARGTSQETTVGFASVPCLGNFPAAHPVPSSWLDNEKSCEAVSAPLIFCFQIPKYSSFHFCLSSTEVALLCCEMFVEQSPGAEPGSRPCVAPKRKKGNFPLKHLTVWFVVVMIGQAAS